MEFFSTYQLESFVIICAIISLLFGALSWGSMGLRATPKQNTFNDYKDVMRTAWRYRFRHCMLVLMVLAAGTWFLHVHYPVWVMGGFIIGGLLPLLTHVITVFVGVKTGGRLVALFEKSPDDVRSFYRSMVRAGMAPASFFMGLNLAAISGYYFYLSEFHAVDLYVTAQSLLALAGAASFVAVAQLLLTSFLNKSSYDTDKNARQFRASLKAEDPRNPAFMLGVLARFYHRFSAPVIAYVALMAVSIALVILTSVIFFRGAERSVVMVLPFLVIGVSIFGVIAGSFFTRLNAKTNIWAGLCKMLFISMGLITAAIYYLIDSQFGFQATFADFTSFDFFVSILVGFVAVLMTFLITSHEGKGSKPFSYGAVISATVLTAVWVAYSHAGYYGVALMAVAMVSYSGVFVWQAFLTMLCGVIRTLDVNSDYLKGGKDVVLWDVICDKLHAIQTVFCHLIAGIIMVLFLLLLEENLDYYFPEFARTINLSLTQAYVVMGLLLGAVAVYGFVWKWRLWRFSLSQTLTQEAKTQLKTIKGLLAGKTSPDYHAMNRMAVCRATGYSLLSITIALGFLVGLYAVADAYMGSENALVIVAAFIVGLTVAGFVHICEHPYKNTALSLLIVMMHIAVLFLLSFMAGI